MSSENLCPRNKHDHERVKAVIAAGPAAAEPILEGLFIWLQDINYPIARPIADFLVTVGDPLIPHIKKILRSNDQPWIEFVLDYVVERLAPEHIHALKAELNQLAMAGMSESDVIAIRIGASAGIWDAKTLNWMLDSHIRACEGFLLELKALKAEASQKQQV
ncbi:DUF5071 domain-containing protein [Undibacterium sp. Ji83W]|uniref:DUF5071 domain-containing protein n=1 Tax=Undibacterium sp. Ji83W TaxID=3413043 RepID=UPI003BF227A6